MKKLILFIFISIGLISYVKGQPKIKNDTFSIDELNFIKKTYSWNKEHFLIISYRQSRKKCHYDNYGSLRKSQNWFSKLHDKITYKDIKIISVSSDEKSISRYTNSTSVFADAYDFFSFRVFPNDASCYCLIVIDRDGKFISKVGEYTDKDINSFISKML